MSAEADLQALDRAIAAVNAEYDAFLYGTGARPPVESRKKVERLIRAMGAAEQESAAERYRFSTLQVRWNALCERWERLQTEKEAGRRPGIYGHFRPSSEAESHLAEAGALNGNPLASVRIGVKGDASAPGAAEHRRALFEKYVAARRAAGETGPTPEFNRFSDSLDRESERLRERFGGAEVEFEVTERDGKIKLVAKPKR
ncbi:MAG: hypothetical protein M3167_11430 [Acidobacteriota bacterium]|nr:hypothetical protein [Acidobacteriota bacterium]